MNSSLLIYLSSAFLALLSLSGLHFTKVCARRGAFQVHLYVVYLLGLLVSAVLAGFVSYFEAMPELSTFLVAFYAFVLNLVGTNSSCHKRELDLTKPLERYKKPICHRIYFYIRKKLFLDNEIVQSLAVIVCAFSAIAVILFLTG